jgi:hypothetical protein
VRGGKGRVHRPQSLASKNHRLSTDQISRTLNKFPWSVARVELGATTARILHWFSAGESTVPGIPQAFSISVISFTEMKLRSHWPSVTPSAGVLVRFPLHIILSVEAALASTTVPQTSKNQRIASRFAIFATQKLRGRQRRNRDIQPSVKAGVNGVCRTWRVE